MASHLEHPPSEPLILKISDYLKSKTERRRVEESSSLVAGIQKLKISRFFKFKHKLQNNFIYFRTFAKKSVTSLQQGRILLTKWANGECQRNSAISDVMFQALELFKMDADDELNFLANSDDFIEVSFNYF